MDIDINTMILLSYAIPKYSKRRYSRRLKVLLPRNKTSSKRIGRNYHWNLLEETHQKKCYHFSNMNFNNEINDNIVNENREMATSSKNPVGMSHNSKSQMHVLLECTGSSYNLLTPPLTPQVGHGQFQFGSQQRIQKQNLESDEQGLPLTPSESDVFAY